MLFEEVIDVRRGCGVNELGPFSELAKYTVSGPQKAALASVLETGRKLRGEDWEKRESGGPVAQNHIAPATANALEDWGTVGEVLGYGGHDRENLGAVLNGGVFFVGRDVRLDVLHEDGEELEIV